MTREDYTVKILKNGYEIEVKEGTKYLQTEPYMPFRTEENSTYEKMAEAHIANLIVEQERAEKEKITIESLKNDLDNAILELTMLIGS